MTHVRLAMVCPTMIQSAMRCPTMVAAWVHTVVGRFHTMETRCASSWAVILNHPKNAIISMMTVLKSL